MAVVEALRLPPARHCSDSLLDLKLLSDRHTEFAEENEVFWCSLLLFPAWVRVFEIWVLNLYLEFDGAMGGGLPWRLISGRFREDY